jgi:two-component system cell cycle sensor histidine kinase/response regulator CckA
MLYRLLYPVLLALCFSLLLSSNASSAALERKTNILVLHSYNKGYIWTDDIDKGIEATVHKSIKHPEFYTTYMDTKRFNDKSYLEKYYEMFKQKYRGIHIDIIITSDDSAYQFMLAHGDELFPDVPVVFNGVNSFSESMFHKLALSRQQRFTGIVEDVDIKKTFDVALTLHPNTKHVYVINDTSEVGKALHAQTEQFIPALKGDVKVVFLEDMEIGEIVERVRTMPKDSLIIFLIFFRDRSGRVFSNDESFRIIQEKASVPIYSCWDIYNGLGVAGGLQTTGYAQGEAAALLAIRILNGEKPSSIPIIDYSPKQYIFDYIQLKRFNINPASLPKGSTVINRPVSFYEANKLKVWIVFLIIIILVGMIALLIINIQKRKRTEISLRESEEKYRELFEESKDAVIITTPEGKYIDVNPAAVEMFGYSSKNELLNVNIAQDVYVNSEDRKALQRILDKNGFVQDYEIEMKRKDGKKLTVQSTITTVRNDTGDIIAYRGIKRDITEHKLAEEQLRESEERYRQLVELSPDAIFIQGKGRIVYINAAGARLFGVEDRGRLLGKQVLDLIHPDYLEIVQERMQQLKEENTEVPLIEEKYLRLDGTPVDVEVAATPFIYQNEPAVQVIARDITERKLVEEALHESKDKISQILNSTAEGIYGLDLNGNCTFCNQSGLRILGYDNEEALIGKNMHELIHHTKADGTPYREDECAARRAIFKREYFHKDREILWRSDRTRFSAEYWAHPIFRDNEFIGTVVTFVDITERVALENQLLQAQKMESVGRLAGGVAHDFNNMLSAILGHAELAMMHCTPSERIHADLKAIEKSALRSAELIRQLLAFASRQTVAPKVLDLNDRVTGMLKMLQRLIGEDIDLVWKPGTGLWPIKIDPSQIDQLLTNLCVNARDAIAGVGKVTIETENTPFDEAYCAVNKGFVCGAYVMLAVSDDGRGMSEEVLDNLFEPFFTTKEVGKGTGLGLATVYGVVKQNEGFVNVYSEPAEGTTFKIYLPRFVGVNIESTSESTGEIPEGRGETVLLVEDETAILNVGKAMLEGLGYKVLTADTPSRALSQFKAHASDIRLLITDVVMPEMNGRDLAKLINEIKPGLKCLFTSGYTADVIAHHGVLDEGVYFLQKPFSMKELASKLREALEQE